MWLVLRKVARDIEGVLEAFEGSLEGSIQGVLKVFKGAFEGVLEAFKVFQSIHEEGIQ